LAFDEIAPSDQTIILHHGKVLENATASEIAGHDALSDRFLSLTAVPA